MGAYLLNKKTGRRFEIVAFDKERGKIKLKGQTAEFEEDFDRAKIEKLGYKLLQD